MTGAPTTVRAGLIVAESPRSMYMQLAANRVSVCSPRVVLQWYEDHTQDRARARGVRVLLPVAWVRAVLVRANHIARATPVLCAANLTSFGHAVCGCRLFGSVWVVAAIVFLVLADLLAAAGLPPSTVCRLPAASESNPHGLPVGRWFPARHRLP